MGESLAIPDGMPQPKNIYLEQIEVLRPILKTNFKKIKENAANDTNKPAYSSKLEQLFGSENSYESTSQDQRTINLTKSPKSIDLTQSPSSSNVKRISGKGKTTTYNSGNAMANQTKAKPGTMMDKLEKAAPYNIFYTTVIKAPETMKQPNALTFTG